MRTVIDTTSSMEYDLNSGTRKIKIEIALAKELQLSWDELLGDIQSSIMSDIKELIANNKRAVLGSQHQHQALEVRTK